MTKATRGIKEMQYTRGSKRAVYLAVLYASQDGRCAICKEERQPEALFIDHDHITGRIRGLLCPSCNTGLGNFKDDPDRLRRAARYLERLTPSDSPAINSVDVDRGPLAG